MEMISSRLRIFAYRGGGGDFRPGENRASISRAREVGRTWGRQEGWTRRSVGWGGGDMVIGTIGRSVQWEGAMVLQEDGEV